VRLGCYRSSWGTSRKGCCALWESGIPDLWPRPDCHSSWSRPIVRSSRFWKISRSYER